MLEIFPKLPDNKYKTLATEKAAPLRSGHLTDVAVD